MTHGSAVNFAKNANEMATLFTSGTGGPNPFMPLDSTFFDLGQNMQASMLAQSSKVDPRLVQSKLMMNDIEASVEEKVMEAMMADESLFKNNLEHIIETPVAAENLKNCYMVETCDSDILVCDEDSVFEVVNEKSQGFKALKPILDKKVTFMKELGGNIYIQTRKDCSLMVYSKIGQRIMKTLPGFAVLSTKISPKFKISQTLDHTESIIWYQGGKSVSFYEPGSQKTTPTDDFIAEGYELHQIILIGKPKKILVHCSTSAGNTLIAYDLSKKKEKDYSMKTISDEKQTKSAESRQ